MKEYNGFFKLMLSGIKEGLALMSRGLLIFLYIFAFIMATLFKAIAKGFERIMDFCNRRTDSLKKISKE